MKFSRILAYPCAFLLGALGCSASSSPGTPTDASTTTDTGDDLSLTAPQPDAEPPPNSCNGLDLPKPQCLHGAPCSCDDQPAHNGTPICVSSAWQCPAGYTRFEDCHGVPPNAECRDAGPDASPDAGPDASPDAAPDASPDAQASACDALDASKPQCLHGAPCSCDDQPAHNGTPICVSSAWQCPAGYTRFEDCHGVPPNAECRDAGLDASHD